MWGSSDQTRMGVVLTFFLWVTLTSHKPGARGTAWAHFDCLKWRDGTGVLPVETKLLLNILQCPRRATT